MQNKYCKRKSKDNVINTAIFVNKIFTVKVSASFWNIWDSFITLSFLFIHRLPGKLINKLIQNKQRDTKTTDTIS